MDNNEPIKAYLLKCTCGHDQQTKSRLEYVTCSNCQRKIYNPDKGVKNNE